MAPPFLKVDFKSDFVLLFLKVVYMSGKPRRIRSIQSYVNHIDNNTFSGPMKMGTGPSIGVTRNYWQNYQTQCNQNPNAVKKSYANMVFLNINSAQTPVSAGFKQSTNYNYTNNCSSQVAYYNPNQMFRNHFYGPK